MGLLRSPQPVFGETPDLAAFPGAPELLCLLARV